MRQELEVLQTLQYEMVQMSCEHVKLLVTVYPETQVVHLVELEQTLHLESLQFANFWQVRPL